MNPARSKLMLKFIRHTEILVKICIASVNFRCAISCIIIVTMFVIYSNINLQANEFRITQHEMNSSNGPRDHISLT
jgi:hypothetical protein